MGSYMRNCAIHGASDLDLLVHLPAVHVKRGLSLIRSDTVLNSVRIALSRRYPGTVVGRDRQAVVIKFASGAEVVDVVPARFKSMMLSLSKKGQRPVYAIPDGVGGWMSSSPASHEVYLENADERSGGKLKHTVQLLKSWRDTRMNPVQLSSFHLELLLASNRVCVGPKSYAKCVADSLALLSRRKCIAIKDPAGISGNVRACATPSKQQSAVASVRGAATHASAAIKAERTGNLAEAYRQWDIVFNSNFPKR
jgi:hypothetical protein